MKYLIIMIAAFLLVCASTTSLPAEESRNGEDQSPRKEPELAVFELPNTQEWIDYVVPKGAKHSQFNRLIIKKGQNLRHIYLEGLQHVETILMFGDYPELETVELVDLPRLKYLALPFSGRAPKLKFPIIRSEFSDPSPLRLLKIPGTAIDSIESLTLPNLDSLHEVDVRNTDIDDRFLKSLEKIDSLRVVRIGGCQNITSEAITEFRRARPEIDLHDISPLRIPRMMISCDFYHMTELIKRSKYSSIEEIVSWINREKIDKVDLRYFKQEELVQLGEQCPNIRCLMYKEGKDYRFLSSFKNLEMLYLPYIPEDAVGLSELAELSKLRVLMIESADVDITATLGKLSPSLRYLDFGFDQNTKDISPLRNLKELRQLRVCSTDNNIDDLSFLETMTKLEVLEIDWVGSNADFTPLSKLDNLKSLKIYVDKSAKLQDISNLDSLQRLEIFSLEIWNISGLHDMKSLRSLYVEMQVKGELSSLKNLDSLDLLHLNTLEGNEIPSLAGTPNLRWLTIDKAKGLHDISQFAELNQLREIKIGNCAIDDLKPLANLKELQVIDISTSGSITDFSPLYGLKLLRQLKIQQKGPMINKTELDRLRKRLPLLNISLIYK